MAQVIQQAAPKASRPVRLSIRPTGQHSMPPSATSLVSGCCNSNKLHLLPMELCSISRPLSVLVCCVTSFVVELVLTGTRACNVVLTTKNLVRWTTAKHHTSAWQIAPLAMPHYRYRRSTIRSRSRSIPTHQPSLGYIHSLTLSLSLSHSIFLSRTRHVYGIGCVVEHVVFGWLIAHR
jgi:hypothetical protein